jgi:tRNA 2-thiouridine synthesizing protein A
MTTSSSSSSSPPTSSPSGDEIDGDRDGDLDLSGETCPFTFVRTRLALEALPLGARLRVVVDHPPAARNVPRSATEWGQEVVAVVDLGGRWAIEIVKRVE